MAITALVSKLARRWAVDVRAIGGEDSDWTRVRGINSLNPAIESTMEDSTDYDSNGWSSSEKTMMGWSLEIGLIEKVSQEDRAQDPGQQIIRDAADEFGGAGFVEVRWYERDDTDGEAYQGNAAVEWAPEGGEASALSNVTATLHGNGERLKIDHPDAEGSNGDDGATDPDDDGSGDNDGGPEDGDGGSDGEDAEEPTPGE